VIITDDFTTAGYAFETSRNFLLNAGVASVICIAVGKYPGPHNARAPIAGVQWNSFAAANLTQAQFYSAPVPYTTDPAALTFF
jgi:hypothetical protein